MTEKTTTTTEAEPHDRRRRRYRLVLVVLGIAMLAVTIGSVRILRTKQQQEVDRQQQAAQQQETEQAIIDSLQRYDDMVRFLRDNAISSLLDLQDNSNSPQHLAVTFLALLDPLRLDIPDSILTTQGYQLITRYVLCVLYFATHGDAWSNQHHFLSELPTCNWWELNLEPETQQHYAYKGVICNSKGIITNLILRKSGFIHPGIYWVCAAISMRLREKETDLTIYIFVSVRSWLLMAANSNLNGNIPMELGLLTTLKAVVFNSNRLAGSIPSSLAQPFALEHLWVSDNSLTGTLPDWIDSLWGLKSLDLSNNRMVGQLPSTLANLEHMELLALGNNMLSGRIETIFNLHNTSSKSNGLRKLQFLYLEGNHFEGPLGDGFMDAAAGLPSPLVALDVSNNFFTGTLPSHLFQQFPNLQVFDANSNQLTGPLPESVNPNGTLQFLALYNNLLTGELSGLLPELFQLTHLDVSSNTFTKWHIDLGALTHLTYLFLADNPFPSGPFPTFLSSLTNLEELSLKSTQRTGTIPTFLSSFHKLVLLDLDDNQFASTIPSELGSLDLLEFLLLNRNQLTGTVPQELSGLSSLRT
jgi:Leucine-rich repeat (LRR) protein/type II secretory pathway pseudopilin PulG